MSTTPKVTATTRVVGRVRFNGYGRWWAVLSGESRIPNESSSFLRFSRFFDPGVTGSKHMGDTSTRLVRFPTLIVPEQAGHSVESVVTATDGVEGVPTFLSVEPYGTHSGHSTSEAFFTTCNPANENLRK